VLVIQVHEQTLPIILELNAGLEVEIKDEPTYFIFCLNGYNEVVTSLELVEKYDILPKQMPFPGWFSVRPKNW
jgi:hypothetical protein